MFGLRRLNARAHRSKADPKLSAANIPQATLDFAHRIFDAARDNNSDLLLQAVDAGLPPNLTNDKGMILSNRLICMANATYQTAYLFLQGTRCSC